MTGTTKKSKKQTATKKGPAKKKAAKTKATKKGPAKKKTAKDKAPAKKAPAKKARAETKPSAKKPSAAAVAAAELYADEDVPRRILELGALLEDKRSTKATQAARVLSEVAQQKPELLTPIVDKLVAGLTSKHKRVKQVAAEGLPLLSRIAPARVAKHLPRLNESFDETNAIGKDGIVRTFAGLCTASVAYQARLEPVLAKALEEADGKTLFVWAQIVLPALKGEPHARAREVVEQRLYRIPRSAAQKIADFLGIRLRASVRG